MLPLSSHRILLTGASGFLGRSVRRLLTERGVPESTVVAPRSREFDLTDRAGVRRLYDSTFDGRGPSLILHCAGFVGGLGANRQWPARFFFDNLQMTMHLVDEARARGMIDRGLKFVQVGTMCSYPEDAPLPYREESLYRGRPDAEIASYGIAKLACHQLLVAYALEHGLKSAYVIPTGFFGPGDNTSPANSHVAGAFTYKYVSAALRDEHEVVNWGSGEPMRDLIYIDDAAEGLLRAAEVMDSPTPINLSSGEEVSIRHIAETIARLAGFQGRTVWDLSKGDGQARRCLDNSRARELLGWTPKVGLEEGLRRTVEWYRARLTT